MWVVSRVDGDSHKLAREKGTQRALWLGGVLRCTHLFLVLGLGSLPQPPELALKWHPTFLLWPRYLLPPSLYLCRASICVPMCGRRIDRRHGFQFTEEET